MSRRTWSSLFRSIFGSFSAKSRKQISRPTLALERMECRTTPAAFSYNGTNTLTIDLDNADEAIALTAQGGGAYVFTSNNNFTGTNTSGLTANAGTLTITNALALTSIAITDSATGTQLTFGASTGSYVDNVSIILDNSAGGISIAAGTSFGDATNNNLTARTTGAITQVAATSLVIGGTATLGAGTTNNITLDQPANDFGTVAITSGKDVTLADANGIVFGASTVGGTLSVTSAGTVSQTGALSVAGSASISAAGQAITLADASNDFKGVVTVTGAATQITSNTGLTAMLATTGSTTVSGGLGSLVVSGSVSGASSDLTTTTTGAGPTTFGSLSLGAGKLTVTSIAVFQTGPILQAAGAGAVTFNVLGIADLSQQNDFSGAVSLACYNNLNGSNINDINSLSLGTIDSGNLSVTCNGPLNLGQGTVGGDLVVTNNGGMITQSGGLSVTGTTQLNAPGQAITLTQSANDFSGGVTVAGGATQITDTNSLTVVLTTTGSTTLSAGGNLVASGTVTGTTSDLTTTTTGTGTTSFGATTVGQNLSVTSAGAVSQTGALSVVGTTQISASGQAITLTMTANNFNGVVTVTGAATQITSNMGLTAVLATTGSTALSAGGNLVARGAVTGAMSDLTATTTGTGTTSFGSTTVGQNLSVTSAGAVSQTGALSVAGTAQISATGQAITLATAANDFTGIVTATGAATQIKDTNALTVALTTTGATVLSAGGNLVASGTVTGTTSDLTTTTTGTGTTNFGATTVGQNLSVTSAGAVGQSGALSVVGTTQISASGQAITLTTTTNNFNGAVTATGAATQITSNTGLTAVLETTGSTMLSGGSGSLVVSGSVSGASSDLTTMTTGAGATSFGATSVGQNLSVTSAGTVSQTGELSVAGAATFAAGTSNITLNAANNAFSTVMVTSGGNVSLAGTGGFTISGISGIGAGNITVAASGTVAGSGPITTMGSILLQGLTAGTSIGVAGAAGTAQFAGSLFGNFADGASSITVGAPNQTAPVIVNAVTFSDPVTIRSTGGSVTANGAITGAGNASVTLSASPTTIFLNADITTAGQDITLDNGAGKATSVILGANVTLDSGSGNIDINATVNGGFTLTLNSGGSTTIGGAVGDLDPLTGITTDAVGTTVINGGAVRTTAAQTYNDEVTLGADTTLTGIGITLNSTVNGAQALVINDSGTTTLSGVVGGTNPLHSITTDAAGALALNGGLLKTAGNQLFNDSTATVGTSLSLTTTDQGNITFVGVVNSAGNLVAFNANGTMPGTGTVEARNAGNDFGTVEVTNAYTASIRDVNDLDIGQSAVMSDLDLTADGNLTDSGALFVGDSLSITATGGDSVIDEFSSAASLQFSGTIGGNNTQFGRLYVQNLQRTDPTTSLNRGGQYGTAKADQGIVSTKAGLTPAGVRQTSKIGNTITLFTSDATSASSAQFYFSTKNNLPIAGLTSKNPSVSAVVSPITSQSFSIDKTVTANNTYNSSSNAPLVYLQTSKASRTATNVKSRAPGDYVLPFAVEETNSGVFYGDARSPNLPLVSRTGTLVFSIDGAADFTSITAMGVTLGAEFALISSTGFDPELTRTFTIINNTSDTPVNGTFAGLPEGSVVNLGNQALKITYKGGDGNDVVLVAINNVPPANGAVVMPRFLQYLQPGDTLSTISNSVQFTTSTGVSRQFQPFRDTGYCGNLSASGVDRTGDGVTDAIVVGVASANSPTTLRVIDAATGRVAFRLAPFGSNFTGGMRVSAGIANVDGEVRSVIVVGAGPGSTPRVQVYDSVNGQLLKSFNAFNPRYRGGVTVSVSTGDVNDPAIPGRLVVATLVNPIVRVFDMSTGGLGAARMQASFNPSKDGKPVRMVNPSIQIGDVDGDRTTLEILFGSGYGSNSIQVFDATDGAWLGGINPFPPAYRGGVRVGLSDVDRDGILDIVLAAAYAPPAVPNLSGFASAVYTLQRNGNNEYTFSTMKGAGDNFFNLFRLGQATTDFYLGINPAVNRLPGASD